MKRTEMLSKIVDIVSENTFDEFYLSINEANILLLELEKLGMLPPYKTKDRQYPECQITHKWEPENETQ